MKVAFKITPIITNFAENYLLAELCNNEISFLIYTQNPMTLVGFYKFELDTNTIGIDYAEAIKTIINSEIVLQQNYATTNIFYNFLYSSLVPTKYFVDTEKEKVLTLMFGIDADTFCFQENVVNNDIKNIYRISTNIYDTINNILSNNSFKHSTTAQIPLGKYLVNTIECIVYGNNIKVLLFKEGNIHIVQFFEYVTPIDVSYHLLNVCERFTISPNDVQLILSGMIEENSNLYSDIYKYFLHISFASLPADILITEDMKAMPNHFYTNLTALAQCV